MHVAEIALRGAGGEPVDFARTIVSQGVAELPPNRVDLEQRVFETTLPIPRGARTVRVTNADGKLHIETVMGSFHERLARTVAHMFRLDEDLSRFYELVREDDLAWCALGAGRMLRAPTVFEDVVKTICTTNEHSLVGDTEDDRRARRRARRGGTRRSPNVSDTGGDGGSR
jgi:3-methyladenine DNA glycosylase/8-oxoguanine DNA glycosylase